MLHTLLARFNGRMQWFIAGESYEIDDELLDTFVNQGVIELAELRETKVDAPQETAVKRKLKRK